MALVHQEIIKTPLQFRHQNTTKSCLRIYVSFQFPSFSPSPSHIPFDSSGFLSLLSSDQDIPTATPNPPILGLFLSDSVRFDFDFISLSIGMSHENIAGVTRLKVGFDDHKPDYVIMTEPDELDDDLTGGGVALSLSSPSGDCTSIWWSFWWWGKLVFLVIFLAVLGICFFAWIGPFLMDKVIPILNWETETFSKPVLAVIIFGLVALFPTFFIPSTPSMWVAGMSFGYGLGLLLIISGVTIAIEGHQHGGVGSRAGTGRPPTMAFLLELDEEDEDKL